MCQYRYEAPDKAMQSGIPNTKLTQDNGVKIKIKISYLRNFKEIPFIKDHQFRNLLFKNNFISFYEKQVFLHLNVQHN